MKKAERHMKNAALRAASFAIFLPLLACAAQQIYLNSVHLENVCPSALTVSMENISNYQLPQMSFAVNVGERIAIGDYSSAGDRDRTKIPTNYLLTISAEGKTKKIKRDDLLKLLEGVEPEGSRYKREWVIKDKAICPTAASPQVSN